MDPRDPSRSALAHGDPVLRPLVREHKGIQNRMVYLSPYFAEFIGCLLLALAWNSIEVSTAGLDKNNVTAPLNVTTMSKNTAIKAMQVTWKPVVMGLITMVTTYALASVSGAHLNPAVSLTVGLSNKGAWAKLWRNMVAQLLGCIAGAQLSSGIYNRRPAGMAVGAEDENMLRVMFLEYVYTATICFVFMNVLLSRKSNPVSGGNQFYAVAIGLAVLAGTAASSERTGAFFNPALAIAIDIQSILPFGKSLLYVMVQIMAAFTASILYRVIRPHEQRPYEEWRRALKADAEIINATRLFSEAAGTFVIVFTFGVTARTDVYRLMRPLSAGSALVSMHYAVSDVSGGYFNPAVTLSVMLNGRGKMPFFHGMWYIGVQVLSSGIASVFFSIVSGPLHFMIDKPKYAALTADIVGVLGAFMVCYVFLATSTVVGINTKVGDNYYHGLAYGFASAAGGFAVLQVANALANPALMMGEGLTSSVSAWWKGKEFMKAFISFARGTMFAMTHFFGSVLASALFRITHAPEYDCAKTLCSNVAESDPLLPDSEVADARFRMSGGIDVEAK